MAIICRDHDGMIWLAIQGHKVLSTLEELLLSEPHGLGVVEIDAVSMPRLHDGTYAASELAATHSTACHNRQHTQDRLAKQ
jgi:hypothetical protein